MGPVFLFDVGIVVFMISPASGELDGLFSVSKVSQEMVVEEFAAIVAIEAADGEWEVFLDVSDLFQDLGFSLSPDGALFSPSGGDIDEVDGIGIHTGDGIAAMSDRIGFEKAGMCFVPLIGFDGDLFSQEGSGFGGGPAPFCVLESDRSKNPVYGWRRDFQQGTGNIQREFTDDLNVLGQPDRQHGLEPFRAGKIRGKPDRFHRSDDRVELINGRFPSLLGFGFGESFEPSEDPDCMFAVTTAGSAEFIQDEGFFMAGRIFIPQVDRFSILSFGSRTHIYSSLRRRCSVTSNYESTILLQALLG